MKETSNRNLENYTVITRCTNAFVLQVVPEVVVVIIQVEVVEEVIVHEVDMGTASSSSNNNNSSTATGVRTRRFMPMIRTVITLELPFSVVGRWHISQLLIRRVDTNKWRTSRLACKMVATVAINKTMLVDTRVVDTRVVDTRVVGEAVVEEVAEEVVMAEDVVDNRSEPHMLTQLTSVSNIL